MSDTRVNGILLFDGPDNNCFGCSPFNDRGLKLAWRRAADGEIEASYTAAPHLNGSPGIVHGGIQAVLLDETMGVAINHGQAPGAERFVVTAHFELDYRRPVPTGVPLLLRARQTGSEGRNYFVEGEICDAEGSALTRASARWVEVPPPANLAQIRGSN